MKARIRPPLQRDARPRHRPPSARSPTRNRLVGSTRAASDQHISNAATAGPPPPTLDNQEHGIFAQTEHLRRIASRAKGGRDACNRPRFSRHLTPRLERPRVGLVPGSSRWSGPFAWGVERCWPRRSNILVGGRVSYVVARPRACSACTYCVARQVPWSCQPELVSTAPNTGGVGTSPSTAGDVSYFTLRDHRHLFAYVVVWLIAG